MIEQKIIELQAQIDVLANAVTSLQFELDGVSATCQGLQQQVTALESGIEEHRMGAFVEVSALQVQIGELQSRP